MGFGSETDETSSGALVFVSCGNRTCPINKRAVDANVSKESFAFSHSPVRGFIFMFDYPRVRLGLSYSNLFPQ